MVDRVKPWFMVHGSAHGLVHGFVHGSVHGLGVWGQRVLDLFLTIINNLHRVNL